MDVELMALGFLMSGRKSGYRMRNIAGKLMLNYNLSLNQVYPILRKFEEANLVKKEVVIQTDRPNKNVFSLTDAGRDYFIKKITASPKPFDYVLDFLVRVLFFRFIDQKNVNNEFVKEITSLQEQLDDLETMEKTVMEKADENGEFSYRTAVHLLRTLIEWYSRESERRQKSSI